MATDKAPKPADIRKQQMYVGWTNPECARLMIVSLSTWEKWRSGAAEMHPIFWREFRRQAHEQMAQNARQADIVRREREGLPLEGAAKEIATR